MSGSGNDFVVVDNRSGIVAPGAMADFARRVCQRRVSIGADGVVLIDHPTPPTPGEPDAHFRWTYINADGSEGEMCGNGAMCGARFAVLHGIAPARCRFQTLSGIVEADVSRRLLPARADRDRRSGAGRAAIGDRGGRGEPLAQRRFRSGSRTPLSSSTTLKQSVTRRPFAGSGARFATTLPSPRRGRTLTPSSWSTGRRCGCGPTNAASRTKPSLAAPGRWLRRSWPPPTAWSPRR